MTTQDKDLIPVREERRRFGRRKIFKKAIVKFKDATGSDDSMNCLVVDVSAGGARIRLPEEQNALPDTLILHILDDDLAFSCHLVYRRDGYAGLEFKAGPWRPSWMKTDRPARARQLLREAISKT